MEKITLFLVVTLVVLTINSSFAQETSVLASCSESTEGRCVGSAYCTACTNCSRCGHCNSGGSCGVCSRTYRKTKKKKSYSTYSEAGSKKSYNLPNDIASEYYLKRLIVNTAVLNLRNGPGTSSAIIERLKKNQNLTFLAMVNNWVKVKVNTTKTEGFVYYKHVLVSSE